MKFSASIIAITVVQAASVVKRDTEQADGLSYNNVQAGCSDYPTDFDMFLNNNKCSDELLDGSICSVGYANDDGSQVVTYQMCTCTYEPTSESNPVVIPVCSWDAHTPSSEEMSDYFPPTVNPFIHTIADTVADTHVDCPPLTAPTGGFLYCTTDRICETRCNRGFIPENIRNNIGVKAVRTCDEESNEWSAAPFTACVAFNTFCNYDADVVTLRNDENAEVSVASVSGPTSINPRVIGNSIVNAECVPTHFVFSGTNEASVQARCSCRYGNGSYYCLKNHASLAVGTCVKPAWFDQADGN